MSTIPQIVVIAGPNGAGKTTSSRPLLKQWGISAFVNADQIALGLSGTNPDAVAVAAGRIMLLRLRELADARESFAFETTLASRSFASWLRELMQECYEVHVDYTWIESADLAVQRVARRHATGGHFVPEETVRRRYVLGMKNLFEQYRDIATSWTLWNNSRGDRPSLIATRRGEEEEEIHDDHLWRKICADYAC